MAKFSQDLFDAICQRIADGESLRAICRDPDMPTRNNFEAWAESTDELRGQYARARDARAEHIFDECFAIADSQEGDVITVDGQQVINHDVIARAKLRIDTRKWALSKMAPKKYGDKLTHSNDPESPMPAMIIRTIVDPKADE